MSDSYNHVFKQSVNGLHRGFISGGSSGGEGAIVGAHASIIGIGTDIGGSIRIPAVLQGLYGLNPTVGRHPNDPSGRNQKYLVAPVSGPLTTTLSSLEFYMETLLESQPWDVDPGLLPIPWRKELTVPPSRPLKLAFIFDDGLVRCQPPVERATRLLADKLKAAGHEIIEWDVSDHTEGYDMWLEGVLADGGKDCRTLCELAGEPLVEGMLVGLPHHEKTHYERREFEDRKTLYQRRYLRRWVESGIDGLVMPVLPWVNYAPKTWVKSNQKVCYTALWNLLNYASLTVPVTTADPALDQPTEDWNSYQPRNEADAFNKEQCKWNSKRRGER
jgi:amidase